MKKSLHVLLESLIDYAGLFPPAGLDMPTALANYQEYRRGEWGWALGQFVVPAGRVAEVPASVPVSVLVEPAALGEFDIVEVKAIRSGDVAGIARQSAGKTVYVEIDDLDLLEDIASARLRAKIRTGGVTADAFPPAAQVAEFIRACAAQQVPFKATAGLHHPLRCVRPLTYERDAAKGTMHGFVNVFIAAALPEHAEKILMEEDPAAFRFEDDAVAWREHAVDTDTLALLRHDFAISFGSCSFEEPIADLEELGWL